MPPNLAFQPSPRLLFPNRPRHRQPRPEDIFVAIDRPSNFASVKLHDNATAAVSREFLLRLIATTAYKIQTVPTNNGIQFTPLAPEVRLSL